MANVTLTYEDHIVVLTLHREKALNALNTEFLQEINKALNVIENNTDVYVLIVTGTRKSFIAGADIKEWNSLSPAEAVEWSDRIQKTNTRLENFRIPVIAAVNGFALGGGNELAMSCDIRIASSNAKFGQPEVGLGVIAGAGGTQRLPKLVGASVAKELLYTGRIISAEEALRIGLVSHVTEPEELMTYAVKLAKEICANAQIAVQETKRVINLGLRTDIDTGLGAEAQAFGISIGTEDKKIGATAFINKEKEKNFIYR